MNQAAYSKGPWSQDKYGGVITHDERTLVTEGVALGGRSTEETRANALLIAAAPELLDALQEIINAADGGGWKDIDPSFGKARAAIAKATRGAA